MNVDARMVALEALLQVEENEGYSNIVLDKTLNKYDLDKRDKALVSIIFRGVLEKKLFLDFVISGFLKDKRMKLAKVTELLLELTVYQIFFLERVPDSAAVNSAVEIAKVKKLPFSFVNAVLRSIIRDKEKISIPVGTSVRSLSIRYSVPEELITLWINSYGYDTAVQLLVEFDKNTQLFLRRNNVRIDSECFISQVSEFLNISAVDNEKTIFKIESSGSLAQNQCFDYGYYHIQDLSSQLLCKIVAPNPGDSIVDVCAAPGGKSFTLAEMMNNVGEIYSFDLYRGRVNLIRKGAERLGLSIINPRMRNAATDEKFQYQADKVLCDVPCSGFGTIRQKPEIRYKRLSDIQELPSIQYKILENSKKLVKVGGLLFYSTCTLNPVENNDICNKFLSNNPDFEAADIICDVRRVTEEPKNQLTIMPFVSGSDGFFVSSFRRKY